MDFVSLKTIETVKFQIFTQKEIDFVEVVIITQLFRAHF
jgi:hypothetical protein